jgi:hypothetical protein
MAANHLEGTAGILFDDASVQHQHDDADHGALSVHGAQQYGGTRIAQVVHQHRRAARARECLDRLADRVMFVRAHGAFAQPQYIALLVMQRHGVSARRLDGRAHVLADGIEIDERTFCRAVGFAVLHRSAA